MKPTYLIYCPWNKKSSGGQIVLHKLAYNLAARNEDVWILSEPMFCHENLHCTESPVKFPKLSDLDTSFNMDNTVVIYPEIISGNPLLATWVCRWILYHTQSPERDSVEPTWDVDDEYFYWQQDYTTSRSEEKKLLMVNDFRLELFPCLPAFKTGTCILYRKRNELADPLIVATFDDITDLFSSVEEFIEVVSVYQTFITYDHCTYYSILAALAGCDSIVLGGGSTPDEFRASWPVAKYGVAFGNSAEELSYARRTRVLIKNHLQSLELESLRQIDGFCEFWEEKLT